MKQIDYGICSAVTDELKYLRKLCSDLHTTTIHGVEYELGTINGKSVAMVATGIGTSCTAAVTTCLAKDFNIKGLFYIGTAGSLKPHIKRGNVVIANSAFEAEIQGLIDAFVNSDFEPGLMHSFKKERQRIRFDADPTLLNTAKQLDLDGDIKIEIGSLVSVNNFQPSQDVMDQIFETDALAIDMESSAVYQVGWLFNLPTLVIRAISNELKSDGDPHNSEVDMNIGEVNAGKVLASILMNL